MNRTENDIRSALATEPDAAAVDRLLSFAQALEDDHVVAARSTRPTRRLAGPLLAAAAVAVLAVGGALLLRPGSNDHPDSGSGPSAGTYLTPAQLRPTWDLAVGHVDGYTTALLSTDRISYPGTYASVTATSTKRPETGSVQTCLDTPAAGCYKALGTAQPVTVAGHAGSWFPGRHVSNSDGLIAKDYDRPWIAAREEHDYEPVLVWRADARTIVLITGTFGFDPATYDYDNVAAKKIMLRLAGAVRTGRHDAISMPFALRNLPSHLAPHAVFLSRGNHCIGYGNGEQPRDRHEWVGAVITACRVTTRHSRAATIAAADNIDPSETHGVSVHDFADGTSMVVEVDDTVAKDVVSATQRQRLAADADVTPRLADPATWLVVR